MKEIDGIYGKWELIPDYMQGGLSRYLSRGIIPGGFLTAVLCNDLTEACAKADDRNRHRLYDYIYFLYNYAPHGSWGSPDNFAAWIERGGLHRAVMGEMSDGEDQQHSLDAV